MPAYKLENNAPYVGAAQSHQTGSTHKEHDSFVTASSFKLTGKECEVISHLVKGMTNKEIAILMGVQEVTIKLHVRGVCQKLDVKNRTQAALKARELGLVI